VAVHSLPPLRDRIAPIIDMNPLAVHGTTIKFSPFSCAIGPPGQDDRNQPRKQWTSLIPIRKIGVLSGSCPAGRQVLATWAMGVLPSGLSLRGPEMSLDMRLSAVSVETAGMCKSEHKAVGLSDPLA
jgi:hypothetical protein